MLENWFILSLFAVVLFSTTQLLDKSCINDLFKTVRGWMSVAGIFSILPIVYIFFYLTPDITSLSSIIVTITIASGVLQMIAYYFYAKAMIDEGADIIAVLWQTMPVYAAICGFFILGESLSLINVTGMVLITGVAIYLMLPKPKKLKGKKRLKFNIRLLIKRRAFIHMQIACILTIISTIILDQLANNNDSTSLLGFYYIGFTLVGLTFLTKKMFSKKHLISLLDNKRSLLMIIVFMGSVEVLDAIANYFMIEAYKLGSYGTVTATMALQPMCIIILASIYRKVTGGRFTRLVSQSHSLQTRFSAFAVLVIGTYALTA